MIKITDLTKSFKVPVKSQKFSDSLRGLLYRDYQYKNAVSNISLEIQAGEIVGLVGENGAGKTTLVKMLAGIIFPTSGTASVLGYTPWERRFEFREQISLVMGQKAQLWWDLPAIDSFELLKSIYQIAEADFKVRLAELTELLEVDKMLYTPLRMLSLGERMKMELIAALLHRPKVIYLDEPTIGLDLKSQKAIRRFLKNYSEEYKPAIILTSHYMDDIEALCERVVLLKSGAIIFDGKISTLTNQYIKNKIITAELDFDEATTPDIAKIFADQNIKADLTGSTAVITCPRNLVKEVATRLVSNFEVLDLKIEEPELGSIIEHIFSSQQ